MTLTSDLDLAFFCFLSHISVTGKQNHAKCLAMGITLMQKYRYGPAAKAKFGG